MMFLEFPTAVAERSGVLSALHQAKHLFEMADGINTFMGYHLRLPKGYAFAPEDFLQSIPSLETPVVEICGIVAAYAADWHNGGEMIHWAAREVRENYISGGEEAVTICRLFILQGPIVHLKAFLFVPGLTEEDFFRLRDDILTR